MPSQLHPCKAFGSLVWVVFFFYLNCKPHCWLCFVVNCNQQIDRLWKVPSGFGGTTCQFDITAICSWKRCAMRKICRCCLHNHAINVCWKLCANLCINYQKHACCSGEELLRQPKRSLQVAILKSVFSAKHTACWRVLHFLSVPIRDWSFCQNLLTLLHQSVPYKTVFFCQHSSQWPSSCNIVHFDFFFFFFFFFQSA